MSKRSSMALSILASLTVMGTILPSAAQAAFPDKPIKIVVPYRAGGGSDGLARTIQAAAEKHGLSSQALVIVNTTGAGGVIGARADKFLDYFCALAVVFFGGLGIYGASEQPDPVLEPIEPATFPIWAGVSLVMLALMFLVQIVLLQIQTIGLPRETNVKHQTCKQ